MNLRVKRAVKLTAVVAMAALVGVCKPVFAGDLNRLLKVEGMTCPICSTSVEHALAAVPGVKSAHADLKSGQVDVVADQEVKPAQLLDAVHKAGFDAEVLNADPQNQNAASGDSCCPLLRRSN